MYRRFWTSTNLYRKHGLYRWNSDLVEAVSKWVWSFYGSYYCLSRPLVRTYIKQFGVWLYSSPDLDHWKPEGPYLLPRSLHWDCERVGPGASPIRFGDSYLNFYYGVDKQQSYHIGCILTEASFPFQVLGRTTRPVLSPDMSWERNGRRSDIVFPGGISIDFVLRNIWIYYGVTDSSIALARIELGSLLNQLKWWKYFLRF